jgi:hypothetical protein
MGVVFMHERVRKLVVWIPFEDHDEPMLDGGAEEGEVGEVPYFREVATRMPRLAELDLRMNIPARLITKPLTSLLSSLPSLETIIFPNYHITSPILSTLSHLPHLHTVQFEYFSSSSPSCSNQGVGCMIDIQSIAPTLPCTNAFPALSDLSLTAPLQDVQRFLELPSAPGANLTSLYVDCGARMVRGVQGVRAFLACVGGGCPLLRALYLDLLWMDRPWVWPVREVDDRVTLDTLEPLFSCPQLV